MMKIRLRGKYSLTLVSLILVTVLVLSGILLFRFRYSFATLTEASSQAMARDLLLQMQKRGEVITCLLAENLSNPLYFYDMETIQNLLSAAKQQRDISFAYVYDAAGVIIQDGTEDVFPYGELLDNEAARKAISSKGRLVTTTHGDILEVAFPIWIGDTPLGGVNVGLSLKNIKVHIAKMERRLNQIKRLGMHRTIVFLAITTLALIAFGIVLSVFAATRLIRPIKKVTDYAKIVGQGKYDFEIVSTEHDEIGDLIDAFNKMKSDLRQTTVSIDVLEKKVSDRTKELESANNELLSEISVRHKTEEKLKKYQEHLEEAINERTADLTKSNKKLKQEMRDRKHAELERERIQIQLQRAKKMEAIGTLAGGVAHDLNNILSGVVGYPELLLLDIPEGSSLREPLKTINESGKKAAAIVQDLLTLARRGVAVKEVVDLEEILQAFLNSPECKRIMTYHPGVSVETNDSHNLPGIIGSSVHLSKTIMNLVSNAAEAMPEGGTIRISTENRYVDVPIRGYEHVEEGDYVVLTVSDTGSGIHPEDMDRIFEPFFTKKMMGRSGTGLGMAVVWGTVKDHNGYVEVKSTVGKGTRFDLYFPATKQAISEKKQSVSIEQYKGNEKILIVDDVKEQRIVAHSMLSKLGYSVVAVSNGEDAIEYMKKNTAGLVVLDMIMDPGIDGLETYKRILDLHPGQKAIITSGFSETKQVKEAQRLGAGKYIKKPYLLEKFGREVRAELDRSLRSSPQ